MFTTVEYIKTLINGLITKYFGIDPAEAIVDTMLNLDMMPVIQDTDGVILTDKDSAILLI